MFRLPFSFGIIGFGLFHLLSLGSLAGWIRDYPRSPDGWFRVHLLVLGWATMIAMGAVYQLISVVLQRKIYSEQLGFVHFGFFWSVWPVCCWVSGPGSLTLLADLPSSP